MKNIRLVIKKELDKIFRFPRMILSTILLPGLLLFIIYSFMGVSIGNATQNTQELNFNVKLINTPNSFQKYIDEAEVYKINFEKTDLSIDELKNGVKEGTIDAVVVFSENLDEHLLNDAQINLIYNSGLPNSSSASVTINQIINLYKEQLLIEQNINDKVFTFSAEQVTDTAKNSGTVLAMLLPLLIITFVFVGSMTIGADAVAGEKERGTLATLLMAPVKRNEIILGKTISTAMLSLLSAISSFIGIIASLPFAKGMFGLDTAVSYPISAFIELFVILFLLGIFSSSLILIASTIAKSTKEASTLSLPFYLYGILVAALSMTPIIPSNMGLYFIPIYNIALALKGIFSFEFDALRFLIVVLSTTLYVTLVIFILVKMFKSEKLLYSK